MPDLFIKHMAKQNSAVVIGGGAAGMFAAVMLGKRGFSVTMLEKNEKAGKKIFITGKGRCNFTNACDDETFFSSVIRNARFLRSSYSAWKSSDTMTFFEDAGMPVKVERGNRAFPVSDHAYDVTDALKRQLAKYRVKVLLHAEVQELITENIPDAAPKSRDRRVTGVRYSVKGGAVQELSADRVIVATGGLSYPTTGSTGDGYRFAEETGHTVLPQSPSLVPFLTEEDVSPMAGLSLKNVAFTLKMDGKTAYTGFGEMLFTHHGISGPLVLSASSAVSGSLPYAKGKEGKLSPDLTESDDGQKARDEETGGDPQKKCTAEIDLKPAIPEKEFEDRLLRIFSENPNRNLMNVLRGVYPSSMTEAVIRAAGADPEKKVHDVTRKERSAVVRATKHFPLTIAGTAGFSEAVITRGGISVKEINPKTMESKIVEGLYFAGEVLDVDALTGGFNLQIAWTTAYAAGNA